MYDHPGAVALILFSLALIPLSALLAHHERHADRSKQPGAIRGDDRSLPWENLGVEHVTPDAETPLYDATVIAAMERAYDWPQVVDFDEWPGGGVA